MCGLVRWWGDWLGVYFFVLWCWSLVVVLVGFLFCWLGFGGWGMTAVALAPSSVSPGTGGGARACLVGWLF